MAPGVDPAHATPTVPRRGLPQLQAIAGVEGFDLEVLNREVAITLKARSRRQRLHGGNRDLLMDRQLLLNRLRLPPILLRQHLDQHHQPLDQRTAFRVGDLG